MKRIVFSIFIAVAAVFVMSLSRPASAAVLTWDSNGATAPLGYDGGGTWDLGNSNWNDAGVNVPWTNASPANDAVFGTASGTAAGPVSVGAAITVGNLTFNATNGSTYTIQNGTLTLSGTPTITTNQDATISSQLAGTGFSKSGAAMLTLSGANTYSGTTTIGQGILRLGNAAAIPAGVAVVVEPGATVDFNGMTVVGRDFTIAGTGSSGQGALFNGTGGPIGQIGVTLAADATIGVTTGRLDIGLGRPLVGNGYTLTKIGGGNLPVRSDAGSFGAIRVNGGTVYFETPQNNMASTPITVASGARLGMYYANPINAPVTLNGGTLSHIGGGGTSTWSGPVTVASDSAITPAGGNLRITGALSGAGSVVVSGAYTLEITTSGSVGGFSGSGNVSLGSGVQLTVGSNGNDNLWTGRLSGAGSIQKVGTGLLAMTNAASTYAAGTTISAGDLASLAPGALGTGTVTLDGGTLNLAVPLSAAAGFGGSGSGWTLNGGATVAGDVLTVTTNSGSQARSAFFDLPVATSDFTVNFTYSAANGAPNPADGLTVIFQTDVRGPLPWAAAAVLWGTTGPGGSRLAPP